MESWGGGGGGDFSPLVPHRYVHRYGSRLFSTTVVNKPSIILYNQTRESISYGIILLNFLVLRMTITKTEFIWASVIVIFIKKWWLISVLLLCCCDENVIGKYDTL